MSKVRFDTYDSNHKSVLASAVFSDLNLPSTTRLLILALDHLSKNSSVEISQRILAVMVGCRRETIITHIQHAVDAGYIIASDRADLYGHHRSKTYTILLPEVA